MIRNLGETNSIFNQFVAELRHVEIQTDRMRFRRNLGVWAVFLLMRLVKNWNTARLKSLPR